MSDRPAIGISAAVEPARWGPWEAEVAMAPLTYVAAVQRSGGLPLVLPPDDGVAQSPDDLLDRLDGLILAGGADVDPVSYGARPHPQTAGTREARDRFELALTHRALERDMPVLGICRGMQLLNVATGGTLTQHLPDQLGHEDHRHTPGTFGDHRVRLEPGSLAARAVGREEESVKSHHHQGVGELGEGLEVTGWSAADDVVEAIEHPACRFALGVLWHPEADEASRVIEALVTEVREGRAQPKPIGATAGHGR